MAGEKVDQSAIDSNVRGSSIGRRQGRGFADDLFDYDRSNGYIRSRSGLYIPETLEVDGESTFNAKEHHYAPVSGEPSAGTYHYSNGLKTIVNALALTTASWNSYNVISLGLVPTGTTGIRVLVYYNTTSSNFYGAFSIDSGTTIEDEFFNYSSSISYVSDHCITRIDSNGAFAIKAIAGAATVYVFMTGYYI